MQPVQDFPMEPRKKVIIIGAGIGGIATAAFMARQGHQVEIFEKNAYPGGRSGRFEKDGHRFDIGATFLMMPGVYRDTFTRLGKSMESELILHRMDPVYKLKFEGEKEIQFTSDLSMMQEQLEAIEKGSYGRFLKLMEKGFEIYERSMPLIDRNYYSFFDTSLWIFPFLLYRYKGFHNHYKYISRFFKSNELRALFTFQNLYMGQNPFDASGMYAFLPFMELADGVYFPEGGMHKVAERLLAIAREQGARITLNAPVTGIETEENRAKGIRLEDGSFHPADILIANADLPFVYNQLLPESRRTKMFNRLSYSCSAVVFHWAVDTVFPQLSQHTVFVSDKHRENCKTIFREKGFPDDPSIYVHSPVRSDPSAAPAKHDSITAIAHSGNFVDPEQHDWEKIKNRARDAIINRFEREGMKGFRDHIKFEMCFTPDQWQSVFNLTRGGTFGSVGHHILQMGFLRPGNYHKKFKNLFFVGGSTQPGSGMPLALLSARLVTERIERKFKNSRT